MSDAAHDVRARWGNRADRVTARTYLIAPSEVGGDPRLCPHRDRAVAGRRRSGFNPADKGRTDAAGR
jgi:hypothetical protein